MESFFIIAVLSSIIFTSVFIAPASLVCLVIEFMKKKIEKKSLGQRIKDIFVKYQLDFYLPGSGVTKFKKPIKEKHD